MKLRDVTNETLAQVVATPNRTLTPELQAHILSMCEDFPSLVQVAASCGVPIRKLRKWIEFGEDGDERYEFFAAEVRRVRQVHLNRYVTHLEELAADPDPKVANARLRATERLLKQLFPSEWGDHRSVTTTVKSGAEAYDLRKLPPEKLRQLRALLGEAQDVNDVHVEILESGDAEATDEYDQ